MLGPMSFLLQFIALNSDDLTARKLKILAGSVSEMDPAKVSRTALSANGLRTAQINRAQASSTVQLQYSALKSIRAIVQEGIPQI